MRIMKVGSLMKPFLISASCQIHVSMSLYRTYYIHENRTWISIHANYKCV